MITLESLKKGDHFKLVLNGKKIHTNFYSIFATKNFLKIKKNTLLISYVAKKKIGNAVKRNKIKRRLKNIMNLAIKKISINYNYSYLLIAKKTVLEDEYNNIKQTIFTDFQRIK